jgi:hypothetical protein
MNGMMRLLWTYLYRCHESPSTVASKLDTLLRTFFPSNRSSVFPPPDDAPEPHVYIVHFVLARHPEIGSELILDLVGESAAASVNVGNVGSLISADKLQIAVQAALLTLYALEREEPIPAWPSSSDFSSPPPADDYPIGAGLMPEALATSKFQDLLARLGPVLAKIALACRASVGRMTIFDDQWALASSSNIAYEDPSNYLIRRHPEGSVFYPVMLAPQMSMLQACYRAWPRLLSDAIPLTDALDMLVCGIVHVEPTVADVASLALRRFMSDPASASALLARYAMFLFETVHKTRESPGVRFVLESARLENMWVSLLDGWIHGLIQTPVDDLEDRRKDIMARFDEIETGALFLLSHATWGIHAIGVKVMRLLSVLAQHLGIVCESGEQPSRVLDLLLGADPARPYLYGFDDFLERTDHDRLEQWRKHSQADVLLRIADSSRGQDRSLWKFVYPHFLKTCADHSLRPLPRLRETMIAATSRYHPFMTAIAASVRGRQATSGQGRAGSIMESGRLTQEMMVVINQWAVWLKIICSTTGVYDSRSAAPTAAAAASHARAPSDFSAEREKMGTARGLYRYLVQFLESEHAIFRNVAALCITYLPAQGYATLLEDLGTLAARTFYDGSRNGAGGTHAFVTRALRASDLYTAVARIYALTAHHLQDARVPGRPASLAHVLKFVRQTQLFLSHPDVRDAYHLQRLRRYFCGTVERLFNGLATLKDSDRFIPTNMHLGLYRLCEEWCQFGAQSAVVKQRLIYMQTQAAMTGENPQAKADSIERFQTQTKKLSKAAVGSLASLCVSPR